MIKHKAVGAVVVAAALSFPLLSAAQSQPPIYGSQLMTQQERAQYRAHMRSLRTAQERERFRMEHHERMQERAQARGVTLRGTSGRDKTLAYLPECACTDTDLEPIVAGLRERPQPPDGRRH